MTCFKLPIDEIAAALLAVQFVENDVVKIWSNGLGPLTINALAPLRKNRKNINSVELNRDFTSSTK
jgi:hypothetical protein